MLDMMLVLLDFSGQQAEVGLEMRATEDPRKADVLALLSVSCAQSKGVSQTGLPPLRRWLISRRRTKARASSGNERQMFIAGSDLQMSQYQGAHFILFPDQLAIQIVDGKRPLM